MKKYKFEVEINLTDNETPATKEEVTKYLREGFDYRADNEWKQILVTVKVREIK